MIEIEQSKMLGVVLIIPAFFAVVFASGELSILVAPDSLAFKGNEKLNSAFLGDVYAASLGRTISDDAQWSGLYITDPFSLPENGIAVVIDGVDNIKFDSKTKTYRLYGSDAEGSLSTLSSKLDVADIDLSDGVERAEQFNDIFGAVATKDIPKETSNLKPKLHSEDKVFLEQIALLNSLSKNLASPQNLPEMTIIRLSLAPIRSAHGDKSLALNEAQQLLTSALENFSISAKSHLPRALIAVVTNEKEQLLRNKRQAGEPKLTPKDINVAEFYSEDYPVIFNIILWFMVVLAFSLLAISYAIATMDPGRDSIIYRMTSTRMKKDN